MIVAQVMVFRDVSPAIRRRFPTIKHLIGAGLLTEDELTEFDAITSPQSKYWQPIQWLFSLVTVAKDEGLIADSYLYVDLIDVSKVLTMINVNQISENERIPYKNSKSGHFRYGADSSGLYSSC